MPPTSNTRPLPRHLLPENCYICGGSSEEHASTVHKFWSNDEAERYFYLLDHQNRSTHSPEAAYVAEHRPN